MDLFLYGELQPLCSTCHSSAKAIEEGTGVIIGGDAQGIPSDPRHHWNT